MGMLRRVGGTIWRRVGEAVDRLEDVLLPQTTGTAEPTNRDYRRIVLVIAIPAIGLFVPSLLVAGVPQDLWVPFTLASVAAAAWISAGFLLIPRTEGFRACLAAASNALVVAGIGWMLRGYYHELVLLYVLLVAGHAVVHGLVPALVTVAFGPAIVPYVLESPGGATNWTDPFYTALYLSGTALITWVGWRLAQRRSTLLGSLRRTSETERSRLAAILASMSDAVVAVDHDGAVVLTNEAYDRRFATLIAVPEDEHGRRLPRTRWPQVRAARGESFRTTFAMRTRGGERRWFEATGEPIESRAGDGGGVVVIRDITDRSLRRLQEQFMATASHELRTPIAALHGYLQLLERHLDPDESATAAGYVGSALSQTRRVGHLLDRLFDLARLQTGALDVELRPVAFAGIVARAVDSARTLTSDQTFELELAVPATLEVLADPGRLEEVLLNLLTNAVTHAPDGETIEVHVRRERDHGAVEIRDHGPGIPSAALSRLFSRGAGTSRGGGSGRGGLGLGLHISRELMRAQGGTLEIASVVGAGTTATIRLPLAPRPALARSRAGS